MADNSPKRRLMDSRFAVASFRYNRWSADLDETQTLEDALEPSFWSSAVDKIMGHDKLNPKGIGDIIEVRKRDTALFAELMVLEVGPGFIKVDLIRKYEPPAVPVIEDAPFTTKWNVGRRAHEVIRKGDHQVMASGFQSKDGAAAWIAKHMTAIAA